MTPWKRRFLLETIIFRCYVSFRECRSLCHGGSFLVVEVDTRSLKMNLIPSMPSSPWVENQISLGAKPWIFWKKWEVFGAMHDWVVVSNIFYFHPHLGKIPILTNIFQRGWNHQPDDGEQKCMVFITGCTLPLSNISQFWEGHFFLVLWLWVSGRVLIYTWNLLKSFGFWGGVKELSQKRC